MELISKKSWSAPILTIIDKVLSEEQKNTVASLQKRKVYIYKLGVYWRMLPSFQPSTRLIYDVYIWELIPPSIIAELREHKADLIIDVSIEPLFVKPDNEQPPKQDIIEIYQALRDLNIPPARIILADSNLSAPAFHDAVVAELGITEPMRIWSLDFAMVYTALKLESDPVIQERITANVSLEKRIAEQQQPLKPFLYLIRRIKFHRMVVILALLDYFKESQIVFSLLGGFEVSQVNNTDLLAYELNSAVKFLEAAPNFRAGVNWREIANRLTQQFPIAIPGSDSFADNKSFAFRSIDGKWYAETFMSIVGESCFTGGESLFITEKLVKPLYWSHPFVVLGDPGTLERLRVLGFRTFNKVIDEHYDTVKDPGMRLLALITELYRLGSLSPAELSQAQNVLAEDVQYNFDYLCNRFYSHFAKLFVDSFAEIMK